MRGSRRRSRLSQIFLVDKRIIGKITESLEISGEQVIEIGPGRGVITERILPKAKKLWCVEIDKRIASQLSRAYPVKRKFSVLNEDILKVDLNSFPKGIIVFGNVPYHISTALIQYLIRYRRRIKCAYLLLQKEFVEKLKSLPGASSYGLLSCMMQYYGRTKILFRVRAGAFRPQPRVDSVFIRIHFNEENRFSPREEERFLELIRTVFKYPRKTVVRSLSQRYPPDTVKEALIDLGFPPTVRPHQISPVAYHSLASFLSKSAE